MPFERCAEEVCVKICCKNLPRGKAARSALGKDITFVYYDGPREGLIMCIACGSEYLYRDIAADEEDDNRVFSCKPLAPGTWAAVHNLLSPSHPIWTSDPKAPQEDVMKRINELVQVVPGPILIVQTMDWENVKAAGWMAPEEMSSVTDWYAWLAKA
jgi:hypothetical protein